jgi:aminoglycoside phosphotransferase (APT) family kinase protein
MKWHVSMIVFDYSLGANLAGMTESVTAQPEGKIPLKSDFVSQLNALWEHRSRYREAIRSLPHTLCHHDAHRRNLIRSDQDDLVAIDWSYVGPGVCSQELGVSLYHSISTWRDISPARIEAFSERMYGAYLSGLADSGWASDENAVRFGFLHSAREAFTLVVVDRTSEVLRSEGSDQSADGLAEFAGEAWRYLLKCDAELARLNHRR